MTVLKTIKGLEDLEADKQNRAWLKIKANKNKSEMKNQII